MRDKGATRDWCGRAYDRQRASGRSRLTAEFSVGRTLGGKPPLNSSPWRRDPWRRGLFSAAPWNNLHHFRIVSVTDSPLCPPTMVCQGERTTPIAKPRPQPSGASACLDDPPISRALSFRGSKAAVLGQLNLGCC